MRRFLRSVVESFAPHLLYRYRERRYQRLVDASGSRSTARIFSEIYENNIWGGVAGTFYSGNGSDEEVTGDFVSLVNEFTARHDVRSIVDLGCGDFRVGRNICGDVEYIGVDVVPSLIARNRSLYQTNRIKFQCLDIVEDPLPRGDLCLVRQVMQHLSNEQIISLLSKLSAFKYAIIAEHHPSPIRLRAANLDKPTGAGIRVAFGSGVFLGKKPFMLPVTILAKLSVPQMIAPGEVITAYLYERDGRDRKCEVGSSPPD